MTRRSLLSLGTSVGAAKVMVDPRFSLLINRRITETILLQPLELLLREHIRYQGRIRGRNGLVGLTLGVTNQNNGLSHIALPVPPSGGHTGSRGGTFDVDRARPEGRVPRLEDRIRSPFGAFTPDHIAQLHIRNILARACHSAP
jgi:hypothetical protein